MFSPIGYAAKSEYATDEIIIKFKANVSDKIEREILQMEKADDSASLTISIDRLNEKFRITEIKPIFKAKLN